MVVPRAVSYLALVLVAVVHLAAQLAAPDGAVADATQPLLVPALAAVLLTGTSEPRPRLVRLALVALFFSWLGDTVPRFLGDDAGFVAMVGCFLLAQVAYVAAFRPLRPRSLLVTRPVLVVPYLVAYVVLVVVCWEGAGALRGAVMIYGATLTGTAVLATGLGRVGGIGGAVFMLSDALIALRAFTDAELPAHSFWVMLTYLVGQALLVVAVRAHAADAERNSELQSVA